MEILTLNKIDGHEKEMQELKCALKETTNVLVHKRYSVLLRHFEDFTKKRIAEMN